MVEDLVVSLCAEHAAELDSDRALEKRPWGLDHYVD
jgi:hypothetical protein